MTLVLPIDMDCVKLYTSNALLRQAIDYYPFALKGMASLCFLCERDLELFLYELGEQIFMTLETRDIDPRQELYTREKVRKFLESQRFYLFSQQFFEHHSVWYARLMQTLPEMEIADLDMSPIAFGRNDAIALRIVY